MCILLCFPVRKSHIPDHVTCALNTACPMQTDTHVADGCTLCRYSIILNTPRSYTDSSSGLETPLMHVFIPYTHSLLLHVSGIIIYIYIYNAVHATSGLGGFSLFGLCVCHMLPCMSVCFYALCTEECSALNIQNSADQSRILP